MAAVAFHLLSDPSHEAFGFLDASSQFSLGQGSQLGPLNVQTLEGKTQQNLQ